MRIPRRERKMHLSPGTRPVQPALRLNRPTVNDQAIRLYSEQYRSHRNLSTGVRLDRITRKPTTASSTSTSLNRNERRRGFSSYTSIPRAEPHNIWGLYLNTNRRRGCVILHASRSPPQNMLRHTAARPRLLPFGPTRIRRLAPSGVEPRPSAHRLIHSHLLYDLGAAH